MKKRKIEIKMIGKEEFDALRIQKTVPNMTKAAEIIVSIPRNYIENIQSFLVYFNWDFYTFVICRMLLESPSETLTNDELDNAYRWLINRLQDAYNHMDSVRSFLTNHSGSQWQ
jgi:hypothetical protein